MERVYGHKERVFGPGERLAPEEKGYYTTNAQKEDLEVEIYLKLAKLFHLQKKPIETIRAYTKAVEYYIEKENYSKSIDVCHKILGISPNHLDTLKMMREIYKQLGMNNNILLLEERIKRLENPESGLNQKLD